MSKRAKKKDTDKALKGPGPARQSKPKPAGAETISGVPPWQRRAWLQPILFILAAIAAAVYVQLSSENIPEIDAFYHLGHASLYARDGIFMKAFPWVAYSVVNTYSSDIWYGFHLLLIPFTFIPDPVFQVKAAGILLLTSLLLVLYLTMRRSKISLPFLWPFLLLFSNGVLVWRFAMVRPHVISMGLAILLFSLMISGSLWAVFLVSLGLTFFHLSFFWLPIFVAGMVAVVKIRTERVWEWRKIIAVLAGLAAGWLLRPNPVGAAKIMYVQVFQLMIEKQKGLLSFCKELAPLPAEGLTTFIPFTAVWLSIAAISLAAIFLRRADLPPKKRTFFWGSLALSVVFFEMIILVSRRSIDQWAPFAVVLIAAGFTYFLDWRKIEAKALLNRRMRILASSVGAIVFVLIFHLALVSYPIGMRGSIRPYRFSGAAEWLKNHARPGEIVFQADVSVFAELFFWNPQNRYINGMDPIFLYAHNPSLYWKVQHLADGEAAFQTWGTRDAAGAKMEETYTVLRRDFKASYLFIQKSETPVFYAYARGDPRFLPCFDDEAAAVFKLSDAGEGEGHR